MELNELCTKLKFEHLPAQLDTLCEQAAKRELNYREFLSRGAGDRVAGAAAQGSGTRAASGALSLHQDA